MKFLTLSLMLSLLLTSTSAGEADDECTYSLEQHPGTSINLDGRLDEEAWRQVPREDRFAFPWREELTPATSFRAFLTEHTLYFAFEAEDSQVTKGEGEGERAVERGDRVEIFFSLDAELERYFSVEIDPWSRILDYSASHYRQFDQDWDLPGLQAQAAIGPGGYTVEAAIPVSSLTGFGFEALRNGSRIIAGLFRAEFSPGADQQVLEKWISWCTPASETPDFHIPSAFGVFVVSGEQD